MSRGQGTWVDIGLALLFAALSLNGALALWKAGQTAGAMAMAAGGALFLGYALAELRRGLRPLTALERVDAWMMARSLFVTFGGLAVCIGLLAWASAHAAWPLAAKVAAVVLLLGGWVSLALYTMSKARLRTEIAAAYKRRLGLGGDDHE